MMTRQSFHPFAPVIEPARQTPLQLRILSRVVHYSNGTHRWARTVFCPHRDARLDVHHCDSCVRLSAHGSESQPDGHLDFIHCWAAPSADDRAGSQPSAFDPLRTPVIDLMTPDVICVLENCTLAQLVALMNKHGLGGVPVVNSQHAPVGFISSSDLFGQRVEKATLNRADLTVRTPDGYVRHLAASGSERFAQTPVADVMTRIVHSLPASATISQAAAVMAERHVDRLPIISEDGALAGMLSAHDLLRWLAVQDGHWGVGQRGPTPVSQGK